MDLAPLQATASGWDFQPGVEWGNPIFYLNAAALVFAIILVVKLRDLRGLSRIGAAGWWLSLVFLAGTGLHFLGDLTNFPEDWDHVLIHATAATALLVFLVKATGSDD